MKLHTSHFLYDLNTSPRSPTRTYPDYPLHSLQFQRLFVVFQHLLQIIISAEKQMIQCYSNSHVNTYEPFESLTFDITMI